MILSAKMITRSVKWPDPCKKISISILWPPGVEITFFIKKIFPKKSLSFLRSKRMPIAGKVHY
jgi:hypothetical protein